MSRCIKCKGCYWVEHTYMPGVKFSTRCPSNVWNDFDAYGAFGKMRIGPAMVEGKLDWTPTLLEIIYADPLCGACDVGCKRNLDLEIELSLEAMRVKAVQDGAGPMPAHKKIAENIAKTHNLFGAAHADRKKWVTPDIKVERESGSPLFRRMHRILYEQGNRPGDRENPQCDQDAFHADARRMVLRQHAPVRRHAG